MEILVELIPYEKGVLTGITNAIRADCEPVTSPEDGRPNARHVSGILAATTKETILMMFRCWWKEI